MDKVLDLKFTWMNESYQEMEIYWLTLIDLNKSCFFLLNFTQNISEAFLTIIWLKKLDSLVEFYTEIFCRVDLANCFLTKLPVT